MLRGCLVYVRCLALHRVTRVLARCRLSHFTSLRFSRPLAKKEVDSIEEKAWQLNQSNETTRKNLEHDWDTLMTLATEFGRDKKSKVLETEIKMEDRSKLGQEKG